MDVKLKADYSAVLHMPILKEVKDRVYQQPSSVQDLSYAQTGEGCVCDLESFQNFH